MMTVSTTQRTVFTLAAMTRDREKIAMLTCYDASFAALIGRAGRCLLSR
jgi:ketopantoate hydroxymethyltransferase